MLNEESLATACSKFLGLLDTFSSTYPIHEAYHSFGKIRYRLLYYITLKTLRIMHHIFIAGPAKAEPMIVIEDRGKIRNSSLEGNAKISSDSLVSNSFIGKYFAIGNFSYLQRATTGRYVTIGSRVSIGAFSHPTDWLSTLEFQFRDSTPFYGERVDESSLKSIENYLLQTTIDPDVWIGDNAFVKTGVHVGTGSIIAAGSVVTKNILPYQIVGGNPARIIRHRFDDKIIQRLLNTKWWEKDIAELCGIEFSCIYTALDQLEGLRE